MYMVIVNKAQQILAELDGVKYIPAVGSIIELDGLDSDVRVTKVKHYYPMGKSKGKHYEGEVIVTVE